MNVDPVASMRCWAVDVELGGRVYEIPPLPAADWWPLLVAGNLIGILDLLKSGPVSPDDLDELLLTGEIGGEEMTTALTDAIEAVAGRSFHAAFVIAVVATQSWAVVGGELAKAGFRWDVQPLGAALDALYSVIMDAMPDQKNRDNFVRLLDNEVLTTGRRRKPDPEKIISEFETLAGPKPTGGLRATGEPSDSERPKTRQRPRPPRPVAP